MKKNNFFYRIFGFFIIVAMLGNMLQAEETPIINAGNTYTIGATDQVPWLAIINGGTLELEGKRTVVMGNTPEGGVDSKDSGGLVIEDGNLIVGNEVTLVFNEQNIPDNDVLKGPDVLRGGTIQIGKEGNSNAALVISNENKSLFGSEYDNKAAIISENSGLFTIVGDTDFTTLAGTRFSNGTIWLVNENENEINNVPISITKSLISSIGPNLNLSEDSVIEKGTHLFITGESKKGGECGTLNIKDSSKVTIDKDDIWGGKINQTGETSTLNFVGNIDKEIDGSYFVSSNGNLNIGDGTDAGYLNLNDRRDKIEADSVVTIYNNSDMNISEGTAILNDNDDWSGKINLSDKGTLTLTGGREDFTSNNQILNQIGGILNIDNSTLHLNEGSNITGGTISLNGAMLTFDNKTNNTAKFEMENYSIISIEAETNLTVLDSTLSNGYIDILGKIDLKNTSVNENVELLINSNSNMNIGDGSSVMLNDHDGWSGKINLSDKGTLTLTGREDVTSNNQILNQKGGELNINNGSLEIKDESVITDGIVNLNNGTLSFNNNSENNAEIYMEHNGDTLNIMGNSTLNSSGSFSNGSINVSGTLNLDKWTHIYGCPEDDMDVTLKINQGANLNISYSEVTVNSNDEWNGNINLNDKGILRFEGEGDPDNGMDVEETNENKTLNQTSGDLIIKYNKGLIMGEGSSITGGGISLYDNGRIKLDNNTRNKATVYMDVEGDYDAAKNNSFSIRGNTVFSAINNSSFKAGILCIGDGDKETISNSNSNFNLKGYSNVYKDVFLEIYDNFNVNEHSELNIDSNDIWEGKIYQDNGTINFFGNINKGKDASFISNGGNINLLDKAILNLDNSQDEVNYGASINLKQDTTINISNGKVYLNDNDNWEGNINLSSDGSLTLTGRNDVTSETKTFNQTGGILNIDEGGRLQINNNSSITGGDIVLNNGSIIFNNNIENTANLYKIGTKDILLLLGSSNFTSLNSVKYENDDIYLMDGTKFNLSNDSHVSEEAYVNISKQSEVNIFDTSSLVIDDKDIFEGTVNLKGGSLELKYLNIVTGSNVNSKSFKKFSIEDIPYYSQEDGTLRLTDTQLSMLDSSLISGGNLELNKNSVYNSISKSFDVDSLASAGLVNGINGEYENYKIKKLYIGDDSNQEANFALDLHARNNENKNYDTYGSSETEIIASNTETKHGVLNISNWNFVGDIFGSDAPIEKSIKMNIFKGYISDDNMIDFTATDKEILTPIGYYKLNSLGNGDFSLDLTKYNSNIFRGQITKLSQMLNQLTINNILFNHTTLENTRKYDNDNDDISPIYKYLWVKTYTTFEKFNMTQDLKVDNNISGTIIGFDSDVKELKNDWNFMSTAYINYNNSNQEWDNYNAKQTGGQLGYLATFYKNNLIFSGLINAGVYDNKMDTLNDKDKLNSNYFYGAAIKTAYNIETAENLILQPNLLVSYNHFDKKDWHTSSGDIDMTSDGINGIFLAPSFNLTYKQETFNVSAILQYMCNINDTKVKGYAGNIDLPEIGMDNKAYIQYGLDFNKVFNDKFSGYIETLFRSLDKEGVLLQLGVNYKFD